MLPTAEFVEEAPARERDKDGSIALALGRLELISLVLGLVWIAFPGSTELDRRWFLGLCAAGALQALPLLRRGSRRMHTISLYIVAGSALLGAGVYLSGGQASPLSLFYLWIASYMAWYLPTGLLWRNTGFLIATYCAAVVIHEKPSESHWWLIGSREAAGALLVSGSVIVATVLVRSFRGRLLDSERLFVAGFERSASPMALIDLDGDVLRANEAFGELVGLSASEVVGSNMLRFTHPDDREITATFYRTTMRLAEGSASYQKRLVAADGSVHWLQVAASLITESRSRPAQIFTQAVDITARIEAELRTRRQVEREAAVADVGRAAISGSDVDGLRGWIAAAALRDSGADAVTILDRDAATGNMSVVCRVGSAEGPEPWLAALAAIAIERDASIFSSDLRHDQRLAELTLEAHEHVQSAVAVLIRSATGAHGVLIAQSPTEGGLTSDDVSYLRSLANVLAEATAKRAAADELIRLESYDPLTGLATRARVWEILRQRRTSQCAEGPGVALAVIDVDGFTVLNDAVGREAGDALLREFAQRLEAVVGNRGTVGRLEGATFVVLRDGDDDEPAFVELVAGALDAVRAPFAADGQNVSLTATAGISFAQSAQSDSALLCAAEAAMTHAKTHQRGGYMLFDTAMHEFNIGRVRTESELRSAIESGELFLAYQPLVSIDTREVMGAEALSRWNHSQRGAIPPIEFIPVAEETGLIVPIGRQAIVDCCEQLAAWRAAGLPPVSLAVNVSPRQLYDDNLREFLRTTFGRLGVDATRLTLELTETMLVADPDRAEHLLLELKALGVKLALDDFGTGYASLAYLSRFPFDIVKLDRSLIEHVTDERKAEIIVGSTIEMSHALGLRVVAEGIETAAQDEALRDLGADIGQGYFYGRPAPAVELLNRTPATA